ncbi:peptidase family M20/M25/M40 protein [Daldinia childiae]|uniref:peptidase family M20/M25/M40 protein n=1 Tax=Daldinia childiae TaxID=326645 RepID=UPI00144551A5|nr:peptidase family M20/M25/M40 protein [Daldinia childiae]KAF3067167.1 peptidase family M20/M25/M40 protein [Daldinia childiae]
MAEIDVVGPRSPTLETLQNRQREMRRARPPDITIIKNENRIPLRPERLEKRESRIGLRSLFGRSRTGRDDKTGDEALPSPKESPRHGGRRTSLADIGVFNRGFHSSRSEVSLLPSPLALAKPSPTESFSSINYRGRRGSNAANKSKLGQPVSPKSPTTTAFDPPPLFKMYPQAIKHATLPACVTPIETLVRFSESKDNSLQNDFSQGDITLDRREAGRKAEGDKKKKSKFAPEWTSKIYSLVTSGYLLQYAAEGSFNRLPEKVLHLTRDSAAYVSDLIPGKHWVVRVTSSTDADGNPSIDAKSLRSRLALRGVEKRQVSNMLLVFENPETMDAWLAILRREIESLGGKKKLSETGNPESDSSATTLKTQGSQRTIVVRDPARFSRIISQDFSWTQENALVDPTEESDSNNPPLKRLSESTVDDDSSMVSSDGQRLDSLRDSSTGNGNRFSFVSSGQRTMVSSAESSPANSPIRASFSSQEEYLFQKNQSPLPPTPEVRPRPNAAAIANRRQSMQTMIPAFDHRLDTGSRPSLTLSPPPPKSSHGDRHQFVPNFSVPHAVGRRYSSLSLSVITPRSEQVQAVSRDGLAKPPPFRRSPPTTLPISRPLSIVLDQPPPIPSCSSNSPTPPMNKVSALQMPDSPTIFSSWASNALKQRSQERGTPPKKSHLSKQVTGGTQNTTTERRSTDGIRASRQGPTRPQANTSKSSIPQLARAQSSEIADAPELIRRPASSFEMRRVSTAPVPKYVSYNCTPPLDEYPTRQNRHSLTFPKRSSNLSSIEEPTYTLSPPLAFSPKRSVPSLKALQQETSPKQLLAMNMSPKALLTRRSMPHLSEGPPPAPPPTCALPPLPGKYAATMPRSTKT